MGYNKGMDLPVCAYPLCKRPYFPREGREELQKYCKPTHRKNAYRLRGVVRTISG